MSEDTLLLSVFVAVEGAHAFSAFMPSYFTVQKFAAASDDAGKLRSGYPPAVLFNLILGGIVSYIVKKPAPVLLAVVVSVFMIALYEGAIRKVGGEHA